MTSYAQLADAILGRGVRPFRAAISGVEGNSSWFQSSQISRYHRDLLEVLMLQAGDGAYMVEVGSFLGDSARAWANAARRVKRDVTVLCIDTWLGDVGMWEKRGLWLGPQDPDSGQPRLFYPKRSELKSK